MNKINSLKKEYLSSILVSNKTPIIGNNRLNENISKNKLKNENIYNKINLLLYLVSLKFL